jgi:hypothetical protein
LVFKGGTSLSKAYQAIGRFSEDVDLTYDICAIAPDLAPDSDHAIPSTRSQEQRWTKTIRERLDVWVSETVAPLLTRRLAESGLSGRAKAEADTVLLTYGERHLRRTIAEFIEHYHHARNHQGLGNELIDPGFPRRGTGCVRRRERLGGLLNYYYRAA